MQLHTRIHLTLHGASNTISIDFVTPFYNPLSLLRTFERTERKQNVATPDAYGDKNNIK